jgi:hypothetical protein
MVSFSVSRVSGLLRLRIHRILGSRTVSVNGTTIRRGWSGLGAGTGKLFRKLVLRRTVQSCDLGYPQELSTCVQAPYASAEFETVAVPPKPPESVREIEGQVTSRFRPQIDDNVIRVIELMLLKQGLLILH